MDKQKNILIISQRPMFPNTDGGALGMIGLARVLKHNNWNIYYATLATKCVPDVDTMSRYSDIRLFTNVIVGPVIRQRNVKDLLTSIVTSNLPYSIWKYRDKSFVRQVINYVDHIHPDAVLCEHLHVAHIGKEIKKKFPKIPIFLREHNVEYKIFHRMSIEERQLFKKFSYYQQYRRMKSYELLALTWFDRIFTVSSEDAQVLHNNSKQSLGEPKMPILLPGSVAAGVPRKKIRQTDKQNLVILHFASMAWIPNQDGLIWFMKSVWPLLERSGSNISLHIAGKDMPSWAFLYGEQYKTVKVSGYVENLADVYQNIDIAIVTIRSGSGIRMKILEHAQWSIPVVSTSVGAEGLPLIHESGIKVADEAHRFAEEILNLAKYPQNVSLCAKLIKSWVTINYSDEAIYTRFEQALEESNDV